MTSAVRRGLLLGVALLLAVPTLSTAQAPDPDRMPQPPRCADAGAVTRIGAWASVRGPRFVERPLGGQQDVAAYVVSPHDQRRVFATNGTSIVGSTDAGCTWRELYVLPDVPTDENPLSVAGSRIAQLVVPEDPRAKDRVLAVANETTGDGRPHVLISPDGTPDSFERREKGLPQVGFVTDLAVADTNPDFLWLAVRFAPSTGTGPGPGGLPTLPPLPPVPGLPGAAPEDAAAPKGALYGSSNGGGDWEVRLDPEDAAVGTTAIDDLVTDPLAANQLGAVSGGVLRHSADAGRTFRAAVPTAAEQRQRGWRVSTLVVFAAPGRTRIITAFTSTSAQGGGPRMLTSHDGGASFGEVRGPGPVDSAVLVGEGRNLLAVSTAPTGSVPAKVLIQVDGAFIDLTPASSQVGFALSTDRTRSATLHARLPNALVHYVGPLVTPPAETPPGIGGVVDDEDLPPLGDGAFLPTADVVELEVGTSTSIEHALELPRRGTPLDVFVLVDTTISMKDDLPLLTADVMRLVERMVAQGIDLRIGLGEFKGQESTIGYRRVLGIGPSVPEFEAALATLNGDGSGLEMQLIALEQALDGLGESAQDLVPASCKATDGNPDRFVLDERRTTPPIVAGQQADFAPSHAKVVLMVTDTTFLRPAGTRLTSDCKVDVAPVADAYDRRGIHVVGVGIDDIDNPRTAEDLAVMAQRTDTLQASGASCAPGLTEGGGPYPAVCRTAAALEPTLLSVVARQSEPARVTLRETPASPAVSLPPLATVDLRRPRTLQVPVTYTCGDEASRSAGVLEASVSGLRTDVVARLPWRLSCVTRPVPALPPLVTVLGPPVVGLLPLAGPPPPPPPAQIVQPQVQTQPQVNPQVQAGTQEEQQEQLELALALQSTHKEGQVEYAMSARQPAVPRPVYVTVLALMTMGAGGLALRQQQRTRLQKAR